MKRECMKYALSLRLSCIYFYYMLICDKGSQAKERGVERWRREGCR